MSRKRHRIKTHEVQGFKYFKAISGLLESLQEVGCQRDRAGNRILHMDQYVTLLLLYLFNPICTSLRSLQQASDFRGIPGEFRGIKGVRYFFGGGSCGDSVLC